MCLGVAIARTGEMDYAQGETPIEAGPDGKVIIQRDEKEVFSAETMASFEGKAVTILHPSDFVTPDNWSSLAKGIIQNVRRGKADQQNDLIADLLITDSVAIALVKKGLREVSCGYEAEYVQTGAGRGVQKSIIGNHLALVEEGRAGSSYAINDHKGKGSEMKLKEKIAAIFAKATDEAMKVTDAEEPAEKKDDKAKDEVGTGYDELMKAVKDLGDKVAAMAPKGKDASTEPTQSEPAEVKAKDDEVAAPSMEDRLAKLEAAVAKILESQTSQDEAEVTVGDESEGEEAEETGDEEGDEEDVKDKEGCVVGDTASRIEILAPGLKAEGKDAKAKALKAAYETTDGKKIINQFTGGVVPDFKNEKVVDAIFIGASELLKVKRDSEFSRTRTVDLLSVISPKGAVTADEINKKNEKFYGSH